MPFQGFCPSMKGDYGHLSGWFPTGKRSTLSIREVTNSYFKWQVTRTQTNGFSTDAIMVALYIYIYSNTYHIINISKLGVSVRRAIPYALYKKYIYIYIMNYHDISSVLSTVPTKQTKTLNQQKPTSFRRDPCVSTPELLECVERRAWTDQNYEKIELQVLNEFGYIMTTTDSTVS